MIRCFYGLTALLCFSLTFISCDKSSLLDTYPFPEGDFYFSSAPLDLTEAKWFIGMGDPNILPKDHGGFVLKHPYVFPASVPVLAVADGVVISVSHGTRAVPEIPDAPQNLWGMEYEDHLLRLQVSKEVIVNYAHITTYHPSLAAAIGDLPADEVGHAVEIEVHAGDTLGFVGPHGAMDFSVTDRRLHLNFLRPSIYPGDFIYSADVFDYFQEPELSPMLAITLRQEPPRGGKIDYDLSGRMIGNWFLEGTTDFIQWSHQLAIVYHHIYGDRVTIADGSPLNDVPGIENPGRPDVYWVKGNAPLPENVGLADGMVKYTLIPGRDPNSPYEYHEEDQPIQGEVLIQMLTETSIKVEFFKGSTGHESFTPAAKVYIR
jgi:hypothetical protein